MRRVFSGFYNLDQKEFDSLWENALFVFDTNVLLNLYRYQISTRDALLAVMENLIGRIWIPYHVGLEFQRNRIGVISEQKQRYKEVKDIIETTTGNMRCKFDNMELKKRHSHINTDQFMAKLEQVQNDFVQELEKLKGISISTHSEDKVRIRLDRIFCQRVGDPPVGQDEIDTMMKEGEVRYLFNIPPGFKDDKKDKNKPDEFSYAGVRYKRKYGDLIIWKQIIQHTIKNKVKDLIFITDDNKADWWWKAGTGSRSIGVHPQLREEISRLTDVERFHIYSTERFLSYANEQLNARVTDDAINEVRAIANEKQSRISESKFMWKLGYSAERAVGKWIEKEYSCKVTQSNKYPDFSCQLNDGKYGFEVKLLGNSKGMFSRMRHWTHQAINALIEHDYTQMNLVLVAFDEETLSHISELVTKMLPEMHKNMRVLIGILDNDERENDECFSLYEIIQSGILM